MTKRDCEKRLLDLMAEAWDVFREYEAEGYHLSMFATEDGCCMTGYRIVDGEKRRFVEGFKTHDGLYRLTGGYCRDTGEH